MKKVIATTLILFYVFLGYAQDIGETIADFPKNEFQINMLNLLWFKYIDVTYERAINDESSFGINTMFSIEGESRFSDYESIYYFEGFTLTPYYRIYFGKKPTSGFFGEAFVIFSTGKYDYYQSDYSGCSDCSSIGSYGYPFRDFTELGIGLSIGTKLLTKRNFVANIHAGVARNFLDSKYGPGAAPRLGISFGWRY
jgi:hypothetical protein